MFGGHLHDGYTQVYAERVNIAESQKRHEGKHVPRFNARETINVPARGHP